MRRKTPTLEELIEQKLVMHQLYAGDQVMHITTFEGVPATVIRQVRPESPEAIEACRYWGAPAYEIEWPDGRREVVARRALATEFSFGPSSAQE